MVLSAALLADLRHLAASVDADDAAVAHALAMLVADLGRAVPSYVGLRLTIATRVGPITLSQSVEDDRPVEASLRLALDVVSPPARAGSEAVFYAARPGAFDALAADITRTLGLESARHPRHVDGVSAVLKAAVQLNADDAPDSRGSGLTGLAEFATLNRAVGLLIGQGRSADDAYAALSNGATAAGMNLHAFALRLLGR